MMALATGIVGLPNRQVPSFNAITLAGAESAITFLSLIPMWVWLMYLMNDFRSGETIQPQRTLPTSFQFVDIAGWSKGASRGEGLGNQFLAHIAK